MVASYGKSKPMNDYLASGEELRAYRWGILEGLIISPLKSKTGYTIGIASHWTPKQVKKDPTTYTGDEVWSKVFEYYVFYYNKRIIKKQ